MSQTKAKNPQRAAPSAAPAPSLAAHTPTPMQRAVPYVLTAIVALWLIAPFVRPQSKPEVGAFRTDEAAMLLVSADGRVKPLDTVARAALMQLGGRQTAKFGDERVPAITWLMDVLTASPNAARYEIFEITHPEVLGLMGMQQTSQKLFSVRDIQPHAQTLQQQMDAAIAVRNDPQREPTPVQRQILTVAGKMLMYGRLVAGESPYAVPPLNENEDWRPLSQVMAEFHRTGRINPAGDHLRNILHSYGEDDPIRFNTEVAQYNALLKEQLPHDYRRAQVEVFYNQYQPFYKGTVIYFGTFLLACMTLLVVSFRAGQWAQTLRTTATSLIVLTFIMHTIAIIVRMYLHGRPPVTNLYSSAVFVGWGCVPLGLIVERFMKRLSLGLMVASIAGFLTLIIAHYLALEDGDTMKNVQAVLDTNFWLATHVPVITLGYSATFLAGLLAAVYILLGVFTSLMSKEVRRDFAKATYGVICFALLLSFVGTVLGGIWADQSWGRFWGWDPKENGAVLIVLINAIILHARWGGMIRERGMMVLAVLGNIITAWSWFGTNMLGVGLHSYGFVDNGRLMAMWGFVFSQLLIMAIGCLPLSLWLSYTADQYRKPKALPAAS